MIADMRKKKGRNADAIIGQKQQETPFVRKLPRWVTTQLPTQQRLQRKTRSLVLDSGTYTVANPSALQ